MGGVMAELMAIVLENSIDGSARIVADRKGGCGGCHTGGGGCRSCLAGAKMETRAGNPLGARAGDLVKVSIDSREVFKGALLLYLLPVAALFAGALIGNWLGGVMHWPPSAGAVGGAFIGLVAAVAEVIHLDRTRYAKNHRLQPTITAIVAPANSPMPILPKGCCG